MWTEKIKLFEHNGSECIPSHTCMMLEKRSCNIYSKTACRIFLVTNENKKKVCTGCYKNEKLHGVACSATKDMKTMIQEINNTVYGCKHTFMKNSSLSEMQMTYKDIAIDGKLSKIATEVVHPLSTYREIFSNNNVRLIENFDLHAEGVYFIAKPTVVKEMPKLLNFLKMRLSYYSNIKYTKFYSPMHVITPHMIKTISCKSRRYSGHRLCHRCVRHATYPKHYPSKICNARVTNVLFNDINRLCI